MSRHLENDRMETAKVGDHLSADHEHVMRDVMTPSDRNIGVQSEQLNSFNEYYNGYLLDRVSRLMQSDCGKEFLNTIIENAKKGEPLHTMLLNDLTQRQLIPQA